MFYQIAFSPQVKRSEIINNKHGIYKLPHNLPNDVKGKLGYMKKISRFHTIIAQCPVLPPKCEFCQSQQKTL